MTCQIYVGEHSLTFFSIDKYGELGSLYNKDTRSLCHILKDNQDNYANEYGSKTVAVAGVLHRGAAILPILFLFLIKFSSEKKNK